MERDQYVPVVTSKSDKQEPKVAPRCRKSDDLMNETGVTAKDSYEDRLIEIFNEIDYLKAECLELLNRMENEDRALPADEINSSERMRKMSEKLTTGN